MEKHEGKILSNYLKGTGLGMEEIAGKLEMSRQNLNYHLNKEIIGDDFKRILFDKMKIVFTNGKWDKNSDLKGTGTSKFIDPLEHKTSAEWMAIRFLIQEIASLRSQHENRSYQECLDELNHAVALVSKMR